MTNGRIQTFSHPCLRAKTPELTVKFVQMFTHLAPHKRKNVTIDKSWLIKPLSISASFRDAIKRFSYIALINRNTVLIFVLTV